MTTLPETIPLIPLITSIPPQMRRPSRGGEDVGPAYQRECIASWISAGFAPYSVNAQREIDEGLASIPGVQMIATARDARHLTGRPHVYFKDVLDEGCRLTSSVFAITNADIRLAPTAGVAQKIRDLTPGRALFARRIDVSEPGSTNGRPNEDGYDLFALHAQDALRLPDFELAFGAPWWDHYLPTALTLMGLDISLEQERFVYHLDHQERWDQAVWMSVGDRYAPAILRYARAARPRSQAARRLVREIENAVQGRGVLRRIRRAVCMRVGRWRPAELERLLRALSRATTSHFENTESSRATYRGAG